MKIKNLEKLLLITPIVFAIPLIVMLLIKNAPENINVVRTVVTGIGGGYICTMALVLLFMIMAKGHGQSINEFIEEMWHKIGIIPFVAMVAGIVAGFFLRDALEPKWVVGIMVVLNVIAIILLTIVYKRAREKNNAV